MTMELEGDLLPLAEQVGILLGLFSQRHKFLAWLLFFQFHKERLLGLYEVHKNVDFRCVILS